MLCTKGKKAIIKLREMSFKIELTLESQGVVAQQFPANLITNGHTTFRVD